MIFSANLQVGISAKFFAVCQFLVLTSMGMYQVSVSLEETFENDKANIKVVFLLMLLKFVSKGLSWMKTALNNSFALSNRNLEIEKEMTITILFSLFSYACSSTLYPCPWHAESVRRSFKLA